MLPRFREPSKAELVVRTVLFLTPFPPKLDLDDRPSTGPAVFRTVFYETDCGKASIWYGFRTVLSQYGVQFGIILFVLRTVLKNPLVRGVMRL